MCSNSWPLPKVQISRITRITKNHWEQYWITITEGPNTWQTETECRRARGRTPRGQLTSWSTATANIIYWLSISIIIIYYIIYQLQTTNRKRNRMKLRLKLEAQMNDWRAGPRPLQTLQRIIFNFKQKNDQKRPKWTIDKLVHGYCKHYIGLFPTWNWKK